MCLSIKAFALTGRGDSTMRKTQGVASLALGFACPGLCAPLGLQPVLAKSENFSYLPVNL